MTEVLMTMFFMLAILLWGLKRIGIYAFLGGIILATMVVIKISAVYYMPVFLLLFMTEILRKEARLKSIIIFAGGGILVIIAYGYLFVLPRIHEYIYWNYKAPLSYIEGFSYKYLLDLFLFNIMEGNELNIYNKFYSAIPILFILSYIIIMCVLVRSSKNWRREILGMSYLENVGLCIITGSMALIVISSLRPERRYLPILLGIIMLISSNLVQNKIRGGVNGLFIWGKTLKGIVVNMILNLPLFSYCCMIIYSITGDWRIVNAGMIKGLSFHGQAILLFPIYLIVIILLGLRKAKWNAKKIIMANSLMLTSQIMGVWIYYIMFYYGRVLLLWEVVIIIGLLLVAIAIVWQYIIEVKIKDIHWYAIGSFIIVQTIIIGMVHINPTYSYEEMGKQVEKISGRAAIITAVSAPILQYRGRILYAEPSECSADLNKGIYYILNWERVGSMIYGPDAFVLFGKSENIGKGGGFIRSFNVLPYGNPIRYFMKFNLWEKKKK